MVVSSSEVIWHDLECGLYRADLPLWLELAASAAPDGGAARVLDVGAGTGRVALELARAGHQVTAVDVDDRLLGALRERSAEEVETICADACTLELDRDDFDLCVMPMQTVQLLDGSDSRIAFLRRARAHLRPGGQLALAIVTEFESFDCDEGDPGPSAESVRIGDAIYASHAIRVRSLERSLIIERERRVVFDGDGVRLTADGHAVEPASLERNVVELQRVLPEELGREAVVAGLRPAFTRELSPTEDHVASTIVVLGV